jgi:hypothetical protein
MRTTMAVICAVRFLGQSTFDIRSAVTFFIWRFLFPIHCDASESCLSVVYITHHRDNSTDFLPVLSHTHAHTHTHTPHFYHENNEHNGGLLKYLVWWEVVAGWLPLSQILVLSAPSRKPKRRIKKKKDQVRPCTLWRMKWLKSWSVSTCHSHCMSLQELYLWAAKD